MFPDHVNPRLLSCYYNRLNCNNYSRAVVTSMLFPQIELNFHLSESLLHNVSKRRTIRGVGTGEAGEAAASPEIKG